MLSLTRSVRYLIPFALGLATATASAATTPRQQWNTDIGQGYQQLASSAHVLEQTATHYCDSPSADTRQQLEAAWKAAFLDWQAVRFVDFGPIEQNSRAWQLQFWPDHKNLVARKVSYALKQDKPVDAAFVDQAGVALQGFPAIEYLLYDADMQQGERALPAADTCHLLDTISTHLAGTADALASDWQAFGDYYVSMDEYTEKTVAAAINGLEILQDKRLAAPMGVRPPHKRNKYLGDAWRSENSVAAMRASIAGFKQYMVPGLTQLLNDAGHPELADKLVEQTDSALAKANDLPDAMAPFLKTDEGYRKLQSLFIDVIQLEQVVEDRIAPALGITRGFNSSDGD
ncbi:imelysin family protein [Marinobacter sp. NFXS9]|uniref:imelysin family protein n=1 Tax=Marinobacter sp. NFXS9 TaxID=2818433 RepID=UPI0032DF417D